MRKFFLYLLFACTHACGFTQEVKLEIPVELKPEVLLGDGSTYNYQTDFRKWSDASGKFSVLARFGRLLPEGMVRFRREGTNERIEVKADLLSPDDRAIVLLISQQSTKVEAARKVLQTFKSSIIGWEEIFRQRKAHLTEVRNLFRNESLDEIEKEDELARLHTKWMKKEPIEINVLCRVWEAAPMQPNVVRDGIRGGIGINLKAVADMPLRTTKYKLVFGVAKRGRANVARGDYALAKFLVSFGTKGVGLSELKRDDRSWHLVRFNTGTAFGDLLLDGQEPDALYVWQRSTVPMFAICSGVKKIDASDIETVVPMLKDWAGELFEEHGIRPLEKPR